MDKPKENIAESITIQEVNSKKELKKFIHLPAAIHKDHSNWVPPIYMDDWEFFNPKKNKSFDSCDTLLLLAYRNNKVVGRIMGVIHRKYNEKHQETFARFAFFETWNDLEVAKALIQSVENWAREKGMSRLVGPLAFSDKDPQGFLIEGYDEPAVIAANCNFPYQVELLEKNQYTKEVDLVEYKINIPNPLPEFYLKIEERATRMNQGLRVLEFTSRTKVKPFIHPVLRLLNATFTEIFGFTPFTEAEMDDFANRYLFLINPRFIKVVANSQNEVVAFVIGMSHIGDGIQKAKGYLFPFGIFKIFAAARKTNQLNLLLGGVDPAYRGKGLDVMMGVKMMQSAIAQGKTIIDSHLELETNTKVRSEMEKMGGVVYKRFRIFGKDL
ncbi:MAG: GNAT family N-acetyltransferase [Bacteroidia bacterium]|jgi:ribosomal protein S18 acetylase RimI-like enzyme